MLFKEHLFIIVSFGKDENKSSMDQFSWIDRPLAL